MSKSESLSAPDRVPSLGEALRERLLAEAAMLDASIRTCESVLHSHLLGCPYCKRDIRQRDLLREAAATVGSAPPSTGLDLLRRFADHVAADATLLPDGCPEPWQSWIAEIAQHAKHALAAVESAPPPASEEPAIDTADVLVGRLRALIAQWRGPDAEDATRRGYPEAGVQLQVCANKLEALLSPGPADRAGLKTEQE